MCFFFTKYFRFNMVRLIGENQAVALISQLLHILLLGLVQVSDVLILVEHLFTLKVTDI